MKKLHYIASALVVSLGYLTASASAIIVKVTDADGEAIPYSSICARTIPSDKNYRSITDCDGLFRITSENTDSIEINVKSLGMAPHNSKYPCSDDTVSITLYEDAVTLSEVVVKGSSYGVVERGDTLSFNPERFTDGSEHNIGDVIKKMPGMSVDEFGNVSFQGQKVDKVLVDGRDVLTSPESFINTLPSDFASQIELIGNYSEGSPSETYMTESRNALNIKRPPQKNQNSINLAAGGGICSKYQSENSAMRLTPTQATSGIVIAYYTGRPLVSMMVWLRSSGTLQGVMNAGEARLSLSTDEREMLFPPVNEDSRDAALANFTYTYDQEEHYRLNANGIFYFTDSHGQSQAIQEYIGSKLTNYQNNYITRHNRFGTLNISNHLKGDNQWSLRSKTSMSIGHNYNTSLLSNSYNQFLLNSSDETSARPFSVTQSVNFERRNAYGIFFTEANATYKSSEIHSFGDSYDNSHRLISASAEISGGWLLSRPNWHGNTLKLSARLAYKYTCEKNEGFQNTSVSTTWPGLYVGAMKNKGLLRYEIGADLFFPITHVEAITTIKNPTMLFQPKIMGEIWFSRQHRLQVKAMLTNDVNDIEKLSSNPWQASSLQRKLSSNMTRPICRTFDASLTYRNMRLFDRLTMLGVAAFKSIRNDGLCNVSNDGLLQTSTYGDGGGQDIFMSQILVNKGLGRLPIDLKLSSKFNWTSLFVSSFNQLGKLITSEPTVTLGFTTRFQNFPANFDCSVYSSWLHQHLSYSDMKSTTTQWGASIKTTFSKNRWNLSLTAKYDCAYDGINNLRFPDLDADVRYKFGSRHEWEVSVTAQNLLHLRNYQWDSSSVTPIMAAYTTYRRLPGYLLCSLSWHM